jgi:muramoyltetrapeptide carboxypeptidase
VNTVLHNTYFQQVFQSKQIRVVAPASGIGLDQLLLLKQLPGLNLSIPEEIVTSDICYHASSDAHRFTQLCDALYDEDDDTVIWTLRGGYGSARLLDKLQSCPLPSKEKTFIGFSDNTALHLFLTKTWHWRSIHGAGLSQLLLDTPDPENYRRIAALLDPSARASSYFNLTPMNHAARDAAGLTGWMQGGNLTLVENSIGTSWQIETDGAFLFLEEVGEKGYRIDRSLNHLRQAGLLKRISAVVFGECIGPDHSGIRVALERFAAESSFPVYETDEFGHGRKNYPIYYTTEARIASPMLLEMNPL